MKVIGLTGGIASGKSSVSSVLKGKYRLPIVDADLIAREVVAPGSKGIQMIEEAFGHEVIAEDGSMDREKMGALMRQDEKVRDRLNEITHPLVEQEVRRQFEVYARAGEGIVVYDCPLLIEAHQDHLVDEILLVTAEKATRVDRIMMRDGCDRQTAEQKIAIQMPEEEKLSQADTVIYNDGSLQELEDCIDHYIKTLDNTMSGEKVNR